MIDKTPREAQAIRDARRPFAEALIALGLMEPFRDRRADEIDRLIEAAVSGYVESLQAQAARAAGARAELEDDIPF
ncbi:MAG: DUF6511 domain-containing protein [Paracoccaceae bacterium]